MAVHTGTYDPHAARGRGYVAGDDLPGARPHRHCRTVELPHGRLSWFDLEYHNAAGAVMVVKQVDYTLNGAAIIDDDGRAMRESCRAR